MKNIFLVLLMSFIVPFGTFAQKIFPNAVGFGTDSRGAYAGSATPTILTVDTVYAGSLQTAANSGSLEWCLSRNYPRIIVFEVGGVIDYSDTSTRKITINDPYVNVYGQTAPSPGITLFSCGLYIETHDVLMQHLKIRLGDHPMPNGSVYVTDCLAIMEDNGGENIVIDHCSLSWSQDELLSCYAPNVTISNCLLYNPLENSAHANEAGEHEPEQHGYGPLVPMYEKNFTFMRNFIGWTTYRNPAYDAVTLVHVNNFTYTYSYRQTHINGSKGKSMACLIGNVSYPTPGRNADMQHYSCFLTKSVPIESRIYLNDNLCVRKENGYSDIENAYLENWTGEMENTILVTSSASTGLDLSEYNIMPSADVEQYLQDSAGAFYWDRDAYDINAMSRLTNRVDDYINSPVDLPARAYNAGPFFGDRIDGGDMSSGYDFSNNPVSFQINGTSITLNQNLTSQSAVLSALNSQLPAGTEAIDHPHELCKYIIIQTIAKGSSASLTITGEDANVFGITTGTYYGSDGYIGYPQPVQISDSLNIPSSPHADDDNDGYTNIEEWAYLLSCNHEVDSTDYGIVSSIQVNGKEIEGFDPNIFSYNIEIPADESKLPDVTAIPVDSTIAVNIIPLEVLPGCIQVEAISCDSSTIQVYKIHFTFLTSSNIENTDYSFEVYPNPAKSKITIRLNNNKKEQCTLILTDSLGKVLFKKILQKELNNHEFDVSSFGKGLYYCNVIFKDKCLTKKIIIL